MMIILIGAQKGGCGKSTLTVNLAVAVRQRHLDVCLVDADSQLTTRKWADERAASDLTDIPCYEMRDNITNQLRELDKKYDVVIADVAGKDSRELRTGMLAAHVLVSPFIPSQPDLDTLPKLVSVTDEVKDFNKELVCLAVVAIASTQPRVKAVEVAREYIGQYPEFILANTTIYSRESYKNAHSEGAGVTEWNDTKAKAEINALLLEILIHG